MSRKKVNHKKELAGFWPLIEHALSALKSRWSYGEVNALSLKGLDTWPFKNNLLLLKYFFEKRSLSRPA
jgi:hypothetical protein